MQAELEALRELVARVANDVQMQGYEIRGIAERQGKIYKCLELARLLPAGRGPRKAPEA